MGGPPSEAREGGNRLRRATTLRKRGEIGLTPLPYPEQRIKRDNITFDRCPANRRLGRRNARPQDAGLAAPAEPFPKGSSLNGGIDKNVAHPMPA